MRRLALALVLSPAAALAQLPAPPAGTPVLDVRCVDGVAAGFPCHRVHLLAHLPLSVFGAGNTNDVWGFAENGREFVLLGTDRGTMFVEITNPVAPVYLGALPAHGNRRSLWRDIEVGRRHAYIVSEAFGHGMQVFDLGLLLETGAGTVTFDEGAYYEESGFGTAHTIAINDKSGFAYLAGSNTCSGGLHMVDISSPKEPRFAGCFAADGYSHDVQCVSYEGPDRDYRRREVCFASNEDTLTIVDVTEKANPRMISRTSYPGVGYTHQTWVTEDLHFLLMDDELDERYSGHNTATRIWDISDLDRPEVIGVHTADTPAIDHNLYVRGNFLFEANYRAGLRILSLDRVDRGRLEPVAFFDVYPADDAPAFNGAWSAYPFFPSGVVAVSGIEQGLFVLEPELDER